MTILLIIACFIAAVLVFIINDRIVKDWGFMPGYAIYILLAPATVPITIMVYLAYLFYHKLIKPRITK